MMSHVVLAILNAKVGKENELKEDLLKIAHLSRQEAGCVEFRLSQDPDNPSQLGLYEQWTSKELYQEHFKKPYVVGFLGKVDSLCTRPFQGFSGKELSSEKAVSN